MKTGPRPRRARELTTPHPEGLTTRLARALTLLLYGNFGTGLFCPDVAQKPLCSILNIFSEPDVGSCIFRRVGSQAGKHSGQPELFYASDRDVAQVRQDIV